MTSVREDVGNAYSTTPYSSSLKVRGLKNRTRQRQLLICQLLRTGVNSYRTTGGAMLNIRLYLATVAVLALAGYGWGLWQHQTGWQGGRTALLAEQMRQTEKQRIEVEQRQQEVETKAAEAEQQGEAKTVTITKEVIRYVKTPGRTVCVFPDERVQLKARAVANANFIPGFDDPAVQDATSGK